MQIDNVRDVLSAANLKMLLEQEFKQIQKDRDILRSDILKNGDNKIHLPVNLPRLLNKAKQDFNISTK